MSMRMFENTGKHEKTKELCSGFSLLDGKEQEHMFDILQALLFATLKAKLANDDSLNNVMDGTLSES